MPRTRQISGRTGEVMSDPVGSAAWPDEPYVVNPEAIGDPDQTPVVRLSIDVAAAFRPCAGKAPSRNGYCGGVNGYHAEDCPDA